MKPGTKRYLIVLLVAVVISGVGIAGASLTVTYEHDEHGDSITDVEYDAEHDIVWSLDQSASFVGWDVGDESVVVSEPVARMAMPSLSATA